MFIQTAGLGCLICRFRAIRAGVELAFVRVHLCDLEAYELCHAGLFGGSPSVSNTEKGLMQQPTAIRAQTAKVSPCSLSQMAVEMSGAVRCRAAVLRAAQCFTESKLPRAYSRTWLERRQKRSCRVPMHAHGFQEWLHVLVTSWANKGGSGRASRAVSGIRNALPISRHVC